jgi:hypothetical protein
MKAIARRIGRLESELDSRIRPLNAEPMVVDLQYIDSDGNVVDHNFITIDQSIPKYRGLPAVDK